MLFNSIDFAIFLPLVFIGYWFIFRKNLKLQNLFIVAASYFFYGFWDWRFLSLIVFSTLVDFFVGQALRNQENLKKRKTLLLVSIFVNLGFLGFFKYYNFFAESFADAFMIFGTSIEVSSLKIILPVGISFYTFQTLSYSIDVYRKKLEPTKDIVAFAAFVSFFPQLVAGPIERATNLLPQFIKKRQFDYTKSVDGLKQILWGLFKKMVIADNCARYANYIFDNHADLSGGTLILGAIFFAFQIYGDFSGYSDIAIGTARLFGINLRQNFAFPYFSRDIAEFWRRWHISLSSWFRDYVYIPLGGSRVSKGKIIRNTFIIFIVSGFWHGANWTFIFWGALNAVYFIPLLLANRNRKNIEIVAKNKILPSFKNLFSIGFTFAITVFAWIFFRAESMRHAFEYIAGIFNKSIVNYTSIDKNGKVLTCIALVILFVVIEWLGRDGKYALEKFGKGKYRILNWMIYYILILLIFVFGGAQQDFIYFQF